MPDGNTRIGDNATEREMEALRAKIRQIYGQAEREVFDDGRAFWHRHYEKAERLREQVAAGKIDKADYDAWLRGQVFQGEQWKERKRQMSETLLNADRTAQDIINDGRVRVFAQNANAVMTEIGENAGIMASFQLYDANSVARIIRDSPDMLPPKQSVGKDAAYAWYNRQMNNAITQGIIQGESLPDIAKRIARQTAQSCTGAMLRHARTAMTGAQNAGRIDGLHKAQEMGVKVKKKWLATPGLRTRDAHKDPDLHKQVIDVDKPFKTILGDIQYPGDISADPANVWNCRCTLTYVYDVGESISGEHSSESAETGNAPNSIRGKTEKLRATMTQALYDEVVEMVDKSPVRPLYVQYGDACNTITRQHNGGEYSPSLDRVIYDFGNRPGMSKYSTMAHEMGHMFDAHIGRVSCLTFNEVDTINQRCVIGSGLTKIVNAYPSTSDQFLAAMRKDRETLRKLLTQPDELNKMKSGTLRNASAGIQDAMDGFFGTQKRGILPWGHGEKYYNRRYNNWVKAFGLDKDMKNALTDLGFDASSQAKVKTITRDWETASELWANVVSALTCGGEELDAFEHYMPNTVAAARQIIGGLI